MTDQTQYIPITTEEAVEAVLGGLDRDSTGRQGACLYGAEIPDLGALIKEVEGRTRELGIEPGDIELRLMSCRILACEYSRREIRLQLNLSNIIRRGGGNA